MTLIDNVTQTKIKSLVPQLICTYSSIIPSNLIRQMCILSKLQIFKPGARRPQRAWFLIIASVRECLYVYVCVCVSAPEAMNN